MTRLRHAPAEAESAADAVTASALKVALFQAEGDRTRAAKALGISRRTIYRWLERLGLKDWQMPEPAPVAAKSRVAAAGGGVAGGHAKRSRGVSPVAH